MKMKKKITNQDRILYSLYLRKKALSMRQLSKCTGLEIKQVYRALQRLKQRDLIIKEKEYDFLSPFDSYRVSIIKIKLKNYYFIEDYLMKRGLWH